MGDSDGKKFGPDDPVTREQLASIFYRYAQVRGYDATQGGMAAGSDLLDLKGTVTRAETAEMLHQFVEKQGLKTCCCVDRRDRMEETDELRQYIWLTIR